MARTPPLVGTVSAFDEEAGYGAVTDATGREWFFHCTALSDGSRTVAVGARVAFTTGPGAPGRWEAATVVKL